MTANNLSDSEGKKEKKSWMPEGLILAAGPVLAYGIVFAHEVGYADVFEIPLGFVSIDVTSILIVTVAMVPVLYALSWLAYMGLSLLPAHDSPIRQRLQRLLVPSLLFVLFLMLYGARWLEWLWTAVFLLIVTFLEFGLPLIKQRKETTYHDKLIAQDQAERETSMPILDLFHRFAGPGGYLAFVGLIAMLVISHSVGRASALDEDEFLVTTTSEEMVVLRIYGDNLICAPFDRATREIKRSFVVLKIGEDPDLVLNLETVGPLHPKD
jgi:hypothetical protein